MPQENLENETLLVSRDPYFNWGLRIGVHATMEMEETTDRVVETVVDTAIDLKDEMENRFRYMISVRMTVDEGLGYKGGQRLAHERAYLLGPALDQYATISWTALRELKLDRTAYQQGFRAGFQDELDGTAHPLPPEQAQAFLGT